MSKIVANRVIEYNITSFMRRKLNKKGFMPCLPDEIKVAYALGAIQLNLFLRKHKTKIYPLGQWVWIISPIPRNYSTLTYKAINKALDKRYSLIFGGQYTFTWVNSDLKPQDLKTQMNKFCTKKSIDYKFLVIWQK